MSITINDIAKKAGVSRATVSRVINNSGYVNEDTRKKILEVIREFNYIPNAIARSLSTNKTNTIGVILPSLTNPFFGRVIKGITEIADQYDLNIILCDSDESTQKEIKSLKMLKEQRIQGLLLAPTSSQEYLNSEYLRLIESLGIPIVWVDGRVEYTNFNGVYVENINGTREGVEAFIREGHRDIAIITGRMNSKPARERLSGYKKALAMHNIPLNEEFILYGDYSHESAYNLTREMLKMKKRPTAVFTCGTMLTIGCIQALLEENIKIPDDIAIIGFDKIDLLNIVGLNISFVAGPSIELGREAMRMLVRTLEDNNSKITSSIILKTDLELNGSEKFIKK